ncbi:MAG: sugar ABC transporter substrate-binding protein, partial [Candidatus Gastranaerophilales bacterium]|nr:sugar ABC transporter substrate-binding protein [Candidatus Gastranaerophilales bacterium]
FTDRPQIAANVPKKHVLKFSSWGALSETETIHSVIKNFEEKNPDIKIDFIHIPQNYFQKIHLLFASGLEPDVIFINNQYIQMYIKAGLLEDLTNYFPDIDSVFFKEALNCFKYKNKLYAIPRDISNLVIYYNKNIFDEQNITPPSKIHDIYELASLARKLTNKNHFGINYEEDVLFWLYYLASNGGGVISDDGKEIIITNKNSYEALNLYSDLINKYHAAPSKSQIGSMTTAQMFINGKIAMYLGGRWMVPKFRETADFEWDIIPFPSGETNKVYIDASGWAVSKKSKNKKAAVEFIKYLSSQNTINEFSKSGLIIPARKDSASGINFLDNKPPKNARAFTEMLKNAKPTPVNENYGSINDILKEKVQTIFNGGKQPKDVFDEKTIKKLESML